MRSSLSWLGMLAAACCVDGFAFQFGARGGLSQVWARRAATRATKLFSTKQEVSGEVRVEDRDVPTAHRGLHDFLYGDDEDHGATGPATSFEAFDGQQSYVVAEWLKEHGDSRHAAVYAVESSSGEIAYVGLSRNVAVSLKAHLSNEGAESVARVRIHSYRYPRRDAMEQLRGEWLAACAEVPRGNRAGAEWASSMREAGVAAMPEEQRRVYEENKLKMRRAMADTTLIDEMEELSSEDIHMREIMMQAAVEGDDWSALIDAQTQKTVDKQRVTATSAAAAPDAVVSPFAPSNAGTSAQAAPAAAAPKKEVLAFTVANVDKVLDEVRPYLVADGGNCAVVSVDPAAMTVSLALQGACGSCPSSTMTMKMGIERVLKENFPDLSEVRQVADPAAAALADLTTDIVEHILEPIRPAIKAMKGFVQVKSAFDGIVTLMYKGSVKIAYGIQLSLQDNPLIREVKFVDEEGKPIEIAK